MRLYDYWRSSAAYRVRLALNFKGLAYEQVAVDLRQGAQREPGFLAINPQGLVPVLEDEGAVLTQSLPILNYLEERYPEPALLPRDLPGRCQSRAIAVAIACEMHPLNNLRVLQYLERELGLDEARRMAWYRHWIAEGFGPLEAMIARSAGDVLRRRRAEPGRCLPGAAGLQRPSLRLRSRGLSDDLPDRRALPADRGLRARRARAPAGCAARVTDVGRPEASGGEGP